MVIITVTSNYSSSHVNKRQKAIDKRKMVNDNGCEVKEKAICHQLVNSVMVIITYSQKIAPCVLLIVNKEPQYWIFGKIVKLVKCLLLAICPNILCILVTTWRYNMTHQCHHKTDL